MLDKRFKRKCLRLWKKQLKEHYFEDKEHPICMTCFTIGFNKGGEKYKKAYEMFMDYWDSFPEDQKKDMDEELKEIGL